MCIWPIPKSLNLIIWFLSHEHLAYLPIKAQQDWEGTGKNKLWILVNFTQTCQECCLTRNVHTAIDDFISMSNIPVQNRFQQRVWHSAHCGKRGAELTGNKQTAYFTRPQLSVTTIMHSWVILAFVSQLDSFYPSIWVHCTHRNSWSGVGTCYMIRSQKISLCQEKTKHGKCQGKTSAGGKEMNSQTVVNSVTSLTWPCAGFKLKTLINGATVRCRLKYMLTGSHGNTQGCTNSGKGTCFSINRYHNKQKHR